MGGTLDVPGEEEHPQGQEQDEEGAQAEREGGEQHEQRRGRGLRPCEGKEPVA